MRELKQQPRKPKKPRIPNLGNLTAEELPEVFDRLAGIARYSDQPGRPRPSVWGMLMKAVIAVTKENPTGLTLPQITLKMGDKVTTKNVGWALMKLADDGHVERVMNGESFTTYVPADRPESGVHHE